MHVSPKNFFVIDQSQDAFDIHFQPGFAGKNLLVGIEGEICNAAGDDEPVGFSKGGKPCRGLIPSFAVECGGDFFCGQILQKQGVKGPADAARLDKQFCLPFAGKEMAADLRVGGEVFGKRTKKDKGSVRVAAFFGSGWAGREIDGGRHRTGGEKGEKGEKGQGGLLGV